MTLDIEKKLVRACQAKGVTATNFAYNRSVLGGRVNAWRLSPKIIKATVLMIHGTGVDSLYPYLGLYYHLLENNYEVCTFDIDGHGHKSTTFFDERQITSCLVDAIKAFALDKNKKPVCMIGHSLGGVLGINFLANVQHVIKLAVVISSPSFVYLTPSVFCVELRSLLFPSIRQQIPYYGWNQIFPPFIFVKRKSFPIRTVSTTNPLLCLIRVKNFINKSNLKQLATKVSCPVLYTYGTKDYLSPLSQGIQLNKLTKNSKLLKISGESHLSTIFSKVLYTRIVNWLDNVNDV